MKTKTNTMKNKKAYLITIEGLVQGVGFRPFIYILANKHKINGWVKNTNKNVCIHAEGPAGSLDFFLAEIKTQAPEASIIDNIEVNEIISKDYSDFTIHKSDNISNEITLISPDIAVCKECLEDLKKQPHRLNYPLINCTHCGPRFSIIKDLPYDRQNTTMAEYKMCDICEKEYLNVTNRRFHAQPVACNNCGPVYELTSKKLKTRDINDIIVKCSDIVQKGGILTLKGTGGYHLACDAYNEKAVNKLRKIKYRETKPFAVMFKNISSIKEVAYVSEYEEQFIDSWPRPIVLLKLFNNNLASGVCKLFGQVGAFIPYMPFHYLLFEKLKTNAIVLTSANLSDEPVITEDEEAYKIFHKQTDAVISYDRIIQNRTDDSVGAVFNNKPRLFRRSRGYAPQPVNLNFKTEGIFAAGAELVNCFCIGKGTKAIISQHIGDLKNLDTYSYYTETIEKYKQMFRFTPTLIVCDKHPDYLSTRYAFNTNLPVLQVQHHYAHIASCMAYHKLNKNVIGFSFDGTGYGDDGKIWGGEVLLCNLYEYERVSHLQYMPLPGGDLAVKEPWRTAIAYLYKTFGSNYRNINIPLLKNIDLNKSNFITEIIDKGINCPYTSSMGRLFDVISAITGICTIAGFHAEAPMRIENITENNIDAHYDFSFSDTISVTDIIKQTIEDIQDKKTLSFIATRFHNTVINIIFAIAKKLRTEKGINQVVLSGGIFQNRYISEKIEILLNKEKFEVFNHDYVPCNDAGIALGQLAVAAQQL